MSLPKVSIVLAVECEPEVYIDCANEGESDRLIAWLKSRDDLFELVDRALEVREEAA